MDRNNLGWFNSRFLQLGNRLIFFTTQNSTEMSSQQGSELFGRLQFFGQVFNSDCKVSHLNQLIVVVSRFPLNTIAHIRHIKNEAHTNHKVKTDHENTELPSFDSPIKPRHIDKPTLTLGDRQDLTVLFLALRRKPGPINI